MAQQEIRARLEARPRTRFGKQVKYLRREGLIPATICDDARQSRPIALDARAAQQVLRGLASAAGMLTLVLDGDELPMLVREVQRNTMTGDILHVQFYRVARGKPVKSEVPLLFSGEAPAARKGGVLLRSQTSVEVESLPGNLPESITVDLSSLENVDDAITAADLQPPPGVTILTNPATLIAKIQAPKVEAEEVEAAIEPSAEAQLTEQMAPGSKEQPKAS